MTLARFAVPAFAILTVLLLAAPPCPAADAPGAARKLSETLAGARKTGVLRCGVGDSIPGFATQAPDGSWRGLDADFCRAVAAAALGDPAKVRYLPLVSRARFTALMAREVDLLARNTSWTLGREAAFQAEFVGPLVYTGQAFMLSARDAHAGLKALDGAKVAVVRGSTHSGNLDDVTERTGVRFEPVFYESPSQACQALFSGECRGFTGDAVVLAGERVDAPGGPEAWAILPEIHSKEILCAVTRQDDGQWTLILRAVHAALVTGEELGLTQANAAQSQAWSVPQRLFMEDAEALGRQLGLEPGWAVRVLTAVGNYGEVFERNLGQGSPLKLARKYNRLWKDGGLLWAPPF
ncbi:Putative amino-acid ABC transporter-binding protein YhdW [Fundidesulfovibrio magnetotacticus]|uniref:Amino-acid ABC transporter-binding protein YhdW n=1 Tax=Fundidesulfovibrio magnetotacticus TaxID=2730080 RepID=A0A6V8LV73_9BACT|nr:transporter substrate-binding domain-containing protein [Fundidesulfovibrio magnetotacticus]GFK94208.1 Putative amino-acid ABC transporter-binding protein YhdW [Fundidesulfovibrio magnetotacticus]